MVLHIEVMQLCDLLEVYGDEVVQTRIFAEFSCYPNLDIEKFLKEKAIPYEKAGKSRTYLVLGDRKTDILFLAYFTLASRPIEFGENLSNKKKIYTWNRF